MTNCPNVLAHGTCSDTSCPNLHNIITCETCALVFPTNELYQGHLQSTRHRSRAAGNSAVSYCRICRINVNGGEKSWKVHTGGKKHFSTAKDLGVSPNVGPQVATSINNEMFCELCQVMVEVRYWDKHLKGDRHISREAFTKYSSAIGEAESDKNEVSVEGTLDFEFVAPDVAARGGMRKDLLIKTTQSYAKCALVDIKLASAHGVRVANPG